MTKADPEVHRLSVEVLGTRFPARNEAGEVLDDRAWLLLEDGADLHKFRMSIPLALAREIEEAFKGRQYETEDVRVDLLMRIASKAEMTFGERMAERLRDLEKDCLQTYGGGYSRDNELEIFRHGMKTVCNVVRAIVTGKKIGDAGT